MLTIIFLYINAVILPVLLFLDFLLSLKNMPENCYMLLFIGLYHSAKPCDSFP